MTLAITPRSPRLTPPGRKPEPSLQALPAPPPAGLRCRDGHLLIEDWRQAVARIEAARDEARKARAVAGKLTTIGLAAAVGGGLLMVAVQPLLPVGLVGVLVGVGLVAASTLLRGASAAKVSAVQERAEAAYARAVALCRGRAG